MPTGSPDRDRLARWLGAANPFKEGDASIGVAAANDRERSEARARLSALRLRDLDAARLFDDDLTQLLDASCDAAVHERTADWTLGALAAFLVRESAAAVDAIAPGLSSVVIGAVVKLLTNEELTRVSAMLFRTLPGSRIGAAGTLGARLQPNSPTDHPDDIRWQVYSGWSYGVGDVLLGTNPVSSDPASVERVERTLQELISTFGLQEVLPHCVLAHIDVQAVVERQTPGCTALWFQSIAGSDAANRTFDLTVAKMLAYADTRTGPFAFYFETGQGADCTNGHGHGVDMVIHESRKYGFARALTQRVAAARQRAGHAPAPWVHVNDVAGFIGPEVFRTREQLVRCCLEDLVMGKLHGLTIGLDVCATLHMTVGLDDLDWCLDQVMPACPAYLMALPTKVDPMLGYLTTGFQDHVRLRTRFGCAINPPMQAFFESLGVLEADGSPGPYFGDPLHVYTEFQRRRGDARPRDAVRAEGAAQMAAVRERGVCLAEGCGAHPWELAPALDTHIRRLHDDAKDALWATVPASLVTQIPAAVCVETCAATREDYLLHPETGERFSARSREVLAQLRRSRADAAIVPNVQIVISDGLNALALTEPGHLLPLLVTLRSQLMAQGWTPAADHLVVTSGRVRAGYRVGEALFATASDRCAIVHVVGERPGTGHHTLSVYVTVAPGAVWSERNAVDHDITRVVSGIAHTALGPSAGAAQAAQLLGYRVAAPTASAVPASPLAIRG
jgi:ethanolamine ammonia-lyase large subunit